VVAICGSIILVMKILLSDVISKLSTIDKHIKEIKEDQNKIDRRVHETNMRFDGVYNILLKRTENLKG
jgi:hypothetical protein